MCHVLGKGMSKLGSQEADTEMDICARKQQDWAEEEVEPQWSLTLANPTRAQELIAQHWGFPSGWNGEDFMPLPSQYQWVQVSDFRWSLFLLLRLTLEELRAGGSLLTTLLAAGQVLSCKGIRVPRLYVYHMSMHMTPIQKHLEDF